MSFSTYDGKSAKLNYFFMLGICIFLEVLVILSEGRSGFVHIFIVRLRKACCEAYLFIGETVFPHLPSGFELRVSSKEDIGTTSGHVCRYRDLIESSCLSYDLSFLFMLLGVQHVMLDAALL